MLPGFCDARLCRGSEGLGALTFGLSIRPWSARATTKRFGFLGLPEGMFGPVQALLGDLGPEVGLFDGQGHLLSTVGLAGRLGRRHGGAGSAGGIQPAAGIRGLVTLRKAPGR